MLLLGRRAAKLFFIGAGKGGVISKTALSRPFITGSPSTDQGTGKKKPFVCDIAVDGISGFLFEFAHHMVAATKNSPARRSMERSFSRLRLI